MDLEIFLEWVFYLAIGVVVYLILFVGSFSDVVDNKAKHYTSTGSTGEDDFREQKVEDFILIHDLGKRIHGLSGLEVSRKPRDDAQKEPKGEAFDKDDAVGNCNEVLSGVLEKLEGEKITLCVGGGESSDDIEEVMSDECFKRPTICKIDDEHETPVAETNVTYNHAEEFEAGESRSGEVWESDQENREGESNELVIDEGNYEEEKEEALFDDWEGVERTELEKRFGAAVAFVGSKRNAERIDRDVRLQLFGLHKVAIEGPCHGPRPMVLKFSACAKWNAWQRLGNMSQDMAMEEYMILLAKSMPEWQESEGH